MFLIMKKLILLLAMFFIIYSYSQQRNENYIFGYRLEYFSDSTNLNVKKAEDFSLLKLKEKSYFISDNYLKKDSIINSVKLLGSMNFSKVPNTAFKYFIIKNSDDINYYEAILSYKYKYTESPEFNWKITNEKIKIGEYNCIKAELYYAGRHWIAWFTTDVEINEGPYKFKGLPGLIVKISDDKFYYSFYLTYIKKNSFVENDLFKENNLNKYKEVTKVELRQIKNNINNNIINELSSYGVSVSSESIDRVKLNIKKNNNPLELKN